MFRDTPDNRELDALLQSVRAPAILLHRPYPPIAGTNAEPGGRSSLPS